MTGIDKELSQKVLELVEHTVDTIILPAHRNLDPKTVMVKPDKSLVTLTDQEAERALTKGLKEIFQANVLGEEAYEENPDIAKYLDSETEYCWIIDPIDGTKNFANGRPDFGVIIALVKNKEIVGGWIYHCTEHRGVYALKGQGVYDEKHKKVVRPELKEQFTGYHNPFYFEHSEFKNAIESIGKARTADIPSPRASSIEYLNLVAGVSDFMINNHCKPWDHAAGQLIISELGQGGGGVFLSGEPYSVQREAWVSAKRSRVLLTTASKKIRDKIHRFF